MHMTNFYIKKLFLLAKFIGEALTVFQRSENMFRYIFITLLIFLPLMFCDKSKPRQSGRKEKLQYQCSDLKFKRGVKQQLLRAQSFVDTFKTAVSTFQGAVDTTKNFVENIKSTADIASVNAIKN